MKLLTAMSNIKFLFVLQVALCISLNLHAQSDRMYSREAAEVYSGTDSYLEGISMDVPEKYTKASAVSLADISVDNFEDKGAKLLRISHQRWIVKIQDNAAVERFSTFNLDSRSARVFGYRDIKKYALNIRKTDGSIIPVNLEKLEKNADDDVAIPNLSVGDILDFGMRIEETVLGNGCFSMSINTLTETFPSLYGYKRYEVGRGFFINFKGLNGAPSLELNEALSDRKNLVYELKYAEMPAANKESWAPKYRTDPTVKMQICYYPLREADQKTAFLGDPYTVKSSVPMDERQKRLEKGYEYYFNRVKDDRTVYFDKWMKKNYPDGIASSETYMNTAFYHNRYFILIFDPIAGFYKDDYNNRYVKAEYFLKVMIQAAQDRNIPIELVFTNNKYWSSWDDVVIEDEVVPLLRYKNDQGEWKYLENPMSYQTTDYITYTLQGQEALAYNGSTFENITVPVVPASENITSAICEVSLDIEKRSATLDLRTSCISTFKYLDSNIALDEVEYHEDASEAMLPSGRPDVMFEKKSAARQQSRSLDAVKADEKVKFDKMKEMRSESFDVDTYLSFELINSGVVSERDSLIYKEKFTVKDVIEKAGPNYIINLSRISFDQVSFTDEEKAKREADIYINYPKTFNYEYRITIPEGYTAAGLDALNQDIDTEYGSVNFSAVQDGSTIRIKLKKVYKDSFIPKEDWGKLMTFLDPASKINDARIVLKAR
jgi:hypothetical protein